MSKCGVAGCFLASRWAAQFSCTGWVVLTDPICVMEKLLCWESSKNYRRELENSQPLFGETSVGQKCECAEEDIRRRGQRLWFVAQSCLVGVYSRRHVFCAIEGIFGTQMATLTVCTLGNRPYDTTPDGLASI